MVPSRVDFPQPLGPMTATIWPPAAKHEISLSPRILPKLQPTLSSSSKQDDAVLLFSVSPAPDKAKMTSATSLTGVFIPSNSSVSCHSRRVSIPSSVTDRHVGLSV